MLGPSRPGLGVVLSAFGGGRLAGTVAALLAQHAEGSDFEVVVVCGEPQPEVQAALAAAARLRPDVTVRSISVSWATPAEAWNLGLQAVTRKRVCFLCAGDSVGPAFVSALLHRAEDWIVGAVPVVGEELSSTGDERTFVLPERTPEVLSTIAGRAYTTAVAQAVGFNPSLRSGTERDFSVRYWLRRDGPVSQVGPNAGGSYLRGCARGPSLAQQLHDFDYAVVDQIKTIQTLEAALGSAENRARDVVRFHQAAVAATANRFLHRHPAEHARALAVVRESRTSDFPYSTLNAGLAASLIISSCPPTIEPEGRVVDVMSPEGVSPPAPEYLDQYVTVPRSSRSEPPWDALVTFVTNGWQRFRDRERERGQYREVRSQGRDPAVHLLAAALRTRHRHLRWSASVPATSCDDPTTVGPRDLPANDALVIELTSAASARGVDVATTGTVNAFVEGVVHALADEIMVANEKRSSPPPSRS